MLVPFVTSSDPQGQWETRGAFKVRRYRPRVEQAHMRIERFVRTSDGRTHWRTRDARNTLIVYGERPDASGRIADPEDDARIFSWLPELQIDANGNAIRYDYAPEDLAGVDRTQPQEGPRARSGIPSAQRYLKRVRWGNAIPATEADPEPAGQHWCFELVLDYGDHDPATPTPLPDRAWAVRPDAFSTRTPGFEVRSFRLCRRLLIFHRFAELGPDPVLVQTYRLEHELAPEGSRLLQVRLIGNRSDSGGNAAKARPPLDLSYTRAHLGESFTPAPRVTAEQVPHGLDGPRYRLVDLYGEGLPGLLVESHAWFYKPNEGGGRFGSERLVLERPSHSIARLAVQDFDGDGNTELMVMGSREAGFYSLESGTGTWSSFQPFASMPHLDAAADARWLDMDGDGRADLVTGGLDRLTWYRSRGRAGFDPGSDVRPGGGGLDAPWRDDPLNDYFFADMTGDGLLDQVLVRDGLVVYWPHLGHGRFGEPVVMDGAPRFAAGAPFDAGRLIFTDLDGSGTADLLYLGSGEITAWTNACGNALLPGRTLRGLPVIDTLSGIGVFDFLGDGTPCLVWSPNAAGGAPLHYLPLTDGVRPGLLESVSNGVGLEQRIRYSSSSTHYLRDRAQGRPWSTRLPRHFTVVDKLITLDRIGRTRSETTYLYHDGSYDGQARSARGFGFVETFDAHASDDGTGFEMVATEPSCIRAWFHLGSDGVSSRERMWSGDSRAPHCPAHMFETPDALTAEEAADALRAASGGLVRSEVFAVRPDGTLAPAPFLVDNIGVLLRRIQPAGPDRRASFSVLERERQSILYEGEAADPRIAHHLVLETDAYGAALLTCDLAYPRRPSLTPAAPAQSRLEASVNRMRWLHVDEPGRVELSLGIEAEEFDVAGLAAPASQVFTWRATRVLVANALVAPLPFDAAAAPPGAARRLNWSRTYYWDSADTAALALGQAAAPARIHHSEAAVFTPGLLAEAYGTRVDASKLAAGHYRSEDGHWWRRSDTFALGGAAEFRRLEAIRRPDGGETRFAYDPMSTCVVEIVDAAGNATQLDYDYHLLAPLRSTDANGKVTEVLYDPLGVAVATTMRGKALDSGGTLRRYGFGKMAAFALPAGATPESAIADPAGHVGAVATVTVYDADRWLAKGEPPVVVILAREALLDDGEGGGTASVAASDATLAVAHHDGFGRPLQQKLRVGPGPAVTRGAGGALVMGGDGRPVIADSAERWQVSGHVVHDRKQQPVRQYEPFFSTHWRFESEAELAAFGVATVHRYDALGRAVRQDNPNGTHSRVEHRAWSVRAFDANDTVQDSAYRVLRETLPLVHGERRALEATRDHADTPVISHVDPLGRTLLVEEADGEGNVRRHSTDYAPDGGPATLVDPRGITATSYLRDMLGRAIRTRSADAGEEIAWLDGFDRPVEGWNGRGVHVARSFDWLDRPLTLDVDGPLGPDRRAEEIVYGEDPSVAGAVDRNLRGQAAILRDDAGVRTIQRCAIDGQPLETHQRVIDDIRAAPDWRTPASVALMPPTFTTGARYDGLGRPVREQLPDGTILEKRYNPGGGLDRVAATSDDGLVSDLEIVAGLTHNARGQRERLRLGNGVEIIHRFDPDTWRTRNVLAVRGGSSPATLQDIDYVFDPVGNVVASVDKVHQPGTASPVIKGLATSAERAFTYNAFYQLRTATGRVHQALLPDDHRTDAPNPGSVKGTRRLSLNNGAQLERYTQSFTYDVAGNMTRLRHVGATAGWTTDFWVAAGSNRSLPALDANGVAVANPTAAFDAAGNMTRLPHLCEIAWGYRNTLDKAVIIDRSAAGKPDDAEYYLYDALRQRVRKRTERLTGAGVVEATDILYLDGCEIKRITRGATLILERRTAHVGDGSERVALIHRWTVDTAGRETLKTEAARIRYQLADHLGSAQLQLDEAGDVIAYEEYLPFGGTAFIAGDDLREVETSAYRFCGKERDDATGLYYFGQRYYAPWLNRWTSPDPAGDVDGPNRYLYVLDNPISHVDPDGLQTQAQTEPKPGKERWVYAPEPPEVAAALEERPDKEMVAELLRSGKWSWLTKGSKVFFGPTKEIKAVSQAWLKKGHDLTHITVSPSDTKLRDSKSTARPKSTGRMPYSNENGVDPGAGGGNATPGPGGVGGGDEGPGAGKGTGTSDDPGCDTVNPGDGKPGGISGGVGEAPVEPGTGGPGQSGGGTADLPGAGAPGAAPEPDSGHGTGDAPGEGKGATETARDSGNAVDPGGIPGGGAAGSPDGEAGAPGVDRPGPGKDSDPNGKPDGVPGVDGKSNPNAGKTGPGGSGGDAGGDPSKSGPAGSPEQPTVMDRITKVAGYWNLEFGDEPGGKSGGIPGGSGSSTLGGWGQTLYLALTVVDIVLTVVSFGGYAGIKAGLKAGLKALIHGAKRVFRSVVKKAASSIAREATKMAAKRSLRQLAGSVGSSFRNWFCFWRDAGGITTFFPIGRGWSYYGRVTNKDIGRSVFAAADTAVHEAWHVLSARVPGWLNLQRTLVGGKPIFAILEWAEETIAYTLGHIAGLRPHGVLVAPLEAFNSVFSNFEAQFGLTIARQAVAWAAMELAVISAAIAAYFGSREIKPSPAVPTK